MVQRNCKYRVERRQHHIQLAHCVNFHAAQSVCRIMHTNPDFFHHQSTCNEKLHFEILHLDPLK